MERIEFNYKNESKHLIVQLSSGIADHFTELFKELYEIPMLQAEKRLIPSFINERGVEFRNMVEYEIPMEQDDVDIIYQSVATMVRSGISKSINHCDN